MGNPLQAKNSGLQPLVSWQQAQVSDEGSAAHFRRHLSTMQVRTSAKHVLQPTVRECFSRSFAMVQAVMSGLPMQDCPKEPASAPAAPGGKRCSIACVPKW